jgi:2-methylcitrate dehydratase PrpD
MHGVIGAELMAMGFTANDDIIDGDIGVARLLMPDGGDPAQVLDGLGSWDMATRGSTIRLHACCGAGHWSMDALQKILRERPTEIDEIERIDVSLNDFLMPNMPYSEPQTGLEGKYSLEYDLAAIALDGRAGIHQYSDEAVQRPAARALMEKVKVNPIQGALGSTVAVTLATGERIEETVSQSHGTPADPLSQDEILGKFRETSGTLIGTDQQDEIIGLCARLETLENVHELADAVATVRG